MVAQVRLRLIRLSALALLPATTGCLSLGGGTTYVQEKPETAGRISALESRISGLEQAVSTMSASETVSPPQNLQR